MCEKTISEVKNEVVHIRVTGKRKTELQSVADYLGITISALGSMAVSEFLTNHVELQKFIEI